MQEGMEMSILTNVFQAAGLDDLIGFPQRKEPLGILPRQKPEAAAGFFEALMDTSFGVAGTVRKSHAAEDIEYLLEDELPPSIKSHPFYGEWVADMAAVSRSFCDIQKTDETGFWIGSERGCSRYHIDNVPLRLLVTYAGTGTEWLPDHAADRQAYENSAPNEKIVKDKDAIQFMNSWDVAVFRGGKGGLLHRTPDAALSGPSVLMRLDHPSFWERAMRQNAPAGASQRP